MIYKVKSVLILRNIYLIYKNNRTMTKYRFL